MILIRKLAFCSTNFIEKKEHWGMLSRLSNTSFNIILCSLTIYVHSKKRNKFKMIQYLLNVINKYLYLPSLYPLSFRFSFCATFFATHNKWPRSFKKVIKKKMCEKLWCIKLCGLFSIKIFKMNALQIGTKIINSWFLRKRNYFLQILRQPSLLLTRVTTLFNT